MIRCKNTRRRGQKERPDEQGFTLVELLVVMVILVLLASLVGPRVVGYLGSSRTKSAKVQIEGLASALELFKRDAVAACRRSCSNAVPGDADIDRKPARGPEVKVFLEPDVTCSRTSGRWFGDRPPSRQPSARKNVSTSLASASGCSSAAKCPPFCITLQRRMSVYVRSASERGGLRISFGNAA